MALILSVTWPFPHLWSTELLSALGYLSWGSMCVPVVLTSGCSGCPFCLLPPNSWGQPCLLFLTWRALTNMLTEQFNQHAHPGFFWNRWHFQKQFCAPLKDTGKAKPAMDHRPWEPWCLVAFGGHILTCWELTGNVFLKPCMLCLAVISFYIGTGS